MNSDSLKKKTVVTNFKRKILSNKYLSILISFFSQYNEYFRLGK